METPEKIVTVTPPKAGDDHEPGSDERVVEPRSDSGQRPKRARGGFWDSTPLPGGSGAIFVAAAQDRQPTREVAMAAASPRAGGGAELARVTPKQRNGEATAVLANSELP
jgi:hypothetical protein